MMKVLLVIAGLVQSPNLASVDAVSGASKSANSQFAAHTTSEIAYKMKKHLEEKACVVDVMNADSVKSNLDSYDLVIIGSGIYGMSPHGTVKKFIQTNERLLKTKKTALFAVCGSICTDSEKQKVIASKLVDKMVFGLTPVSKTVFRGKILDYGKFLNWVGAQFFKTYPPGDYREWEVIRTWTLALVN